MYCHAPTVAYRYIGVNSATGKPYKPFSFFPFKDDATFLRLCNKPLPDGYERLILPCNKCLLCTRRYRKIWSLRCMHELRSYNHACYLTLTVDDDNIDHVFPRLPGSDWHSLHYKPFQDFLKRLRIRLARGYKYSDSRSPYFGELGKPVRFYMCGEYGDEGHRPHYHVILFGVMPPDVVPLLGRKNLYTSRLFSLTWPFGFHTVGKVEEDSVSYVAGYCDKKLDGSRAMVALANNVNPEFVSMSRGCKKNGTGGIGKAFFDRYHDTDLYPQNKDGTFARTCALDRCGYYVKMPRYYDELLHLHDPVKYDMLLTSRRVGAAENDVNLEDWLNVSHLKHEVATARRRKRDPGVMI